MLAIRVIRRNKVFSTLNILGLAVGIAVCLLTFLVIRYEKSYDAWQSNKDRVFRVVTNYKNWSNGEITGRKQGVPLGLADVMRTEYPEVKNIAAVWSSWPTSQIYIPPADGSKTEEKKYKEPGVFFTDPELFRIFDFTWLAGNATALTDPHTAVITESYANKYFGSWKNAMGRTIQLWSFRIPFQVVGVFKDLPENTDMQVKIGMSYAIMKVLNKEAFEYKDRWHFTVNSSQLYMLLPRQMEAGSLQARLPALVKKYYDEKQSTNQSQSQLVLQPLTDMHTNTDYSTYKGDGLSRQILWVLGLIGAFVLAVACINFINLSTAASVNRAREVGVRKVLGSNRGQLFRQFMFETALITLFSLLLGCLLAQLALPFLRQLMGKPISLGQLYTPSLIIFLLTIWAVIVILAGSYPAIILSGFNPIAAIKSKITARTIGGVSLRKGLVVFQFVIAQLLIVGTLVVVRQMYLFRHRPLGFEKAATAYIDLPSDSTDRTKYGYLKQQLSNVPGVTNASLCMDVPSSNATVEDEFFFDNSPVKGDFKVNFQMADTDYLATFQIGMVAGRLPYNRDTAVRELLVNETMVKKLGLHSPDQILGRTMALNSPDWKFRVVGVIRDYNSKSLHNALSPLVMAPLDGAYNYIALRLEPQQIKSTMEQVQKKFTGIYPSYIYDCKFLDESIAHFYLTEDITSELVRWSAVLSIFISCLGLYGLVSFMAVQKTKEVGVRKVLGASIGNILLLFSREFTILPLIAFLVAAPLGFYFAHRWLSGFYYHIDLNWDIFLLALTLSLAIAWLTVGYKAMRAARANPVKSLRSE